MHTDLQPIELLRETAARWDLPLSATQIEQFRLYSTELQRWNERLNLTTVDSPHGIVTRHLLDSISCARWWGQPPERLIDIGSGAGFPGIPLKILRPEAQLTLVESIAKKANFLQHVSTTLGLTQVEILPSRAEVIGQNPAYRERADLATARAVADLRVLAEYCLPLVRIGGRFLAPKGPASADEIAAAEEAIRSLGGQLIEVATVELPGEPARRLVVIEKIATTPTRYPRAAGIPSKRPL